MLDLPFARRMMAIFFMLGFGFGLLVAIFLTLAGPAAAHDHWIGRGRLTDPQTKQWCCDQRDCRPEPTNVIVAPGGYRIRTSGEHIPHSRVIWRSPDGKPWRCRDLATDRTRCLIMPMPAF